jgi:two-component system sensor histidine kinase/response regulator
MSTWKPSVLMVDDVDANLVALEAQLGTLDCELVRARSGNAALRELLKREFAVMLLDVQMPGMDGYEVARYARDNSSTRDVPIVFVTAMLETEEKMLRGYGAGAVDILFKPINPYILRSKVQVFLDLYMAKRKLANEIEARRRTLAELEAFNYSVSHDLRAPLRPLDGFSQALLEECGDKLDEKSRGYLNRIRAAAQRMGELIDDLLRLSRISSAQMRVQMVDLSAIAESIVAELRKGEPTRDVHFIGAPNVIALCDSGLLRIVLENLLRNAWKFSSKKVTSRIEFGRTEEKNRTVYFVRDDGAGFDPEYAKRLFQPFQRLHSSSEFDGTGIGLAIVNRIVSHHNGTMWAQAKPGEGATFFFTLQASLIAA